MEPPEGDGEPRAAPPLEWRERAPDLGDLTPNAPSPPDDETAPPTPWRRRGPPGRARLIAAGAWLVLVGLALGGVSAWALVVAADPPRWAADRPGGEVSVILEGASFDFGANASRGNVTLTDLDGALMRWAPLGEFGDASLRSPRAVGIATIESGGQTWTRRYLVPEDSTVEIRIDPASSPTTSSAWMGMNALQNPLVWLLLVLGLLWIAGGAACFVGRPSWLALIAAVTLLGYNLVALFGGPSARGGILLLAAAVVCWAVLTAPFPWRAAEAGAKTPPGQG